MIILGIDPALRTTGYGVVEMDGRDFSALDCGVIKNSRTAALSECLSRVSSGVELLVDSFSPDVGAIEGGFSHKNARTAMVLGMVRGAIVSALARRGLECYEYAPRKAKQMVVGYGNASKAQVVTFIANMMKLDESAIPDDASDAMGIAVCHGMTLTSHNGLYMPKPL